MEPVKPDIGRPYFRAVSTLQPLALLEMDPSPGSGDGSNPLRWWTRSQRIRTTAELPFGVALLETIEGLLYQRISTEVRRLHRLGLSLSRIAAHLDVSDKTAARALAWADRG